MPRNLERDAIRMTDRKERLIKAGFELFSQKGIESVSLQEVAKEAKVPIATLYKYYQNKVNLVIAISAFVWGQVWDRFAGDDERAGKRDAYEMIEFYCNAIIELYHERPDILCFSSNYKTYITREGASVEELSEQLDVLEPISRRFHENYEKAKEDHSIRTDIDEKELFATLTLTMLGMAERYAQGLVWARPDDEDCTRELVNLKEMLLMWVRG